jgi:hypothetical protein
MLNTGFFNRSGMERTQIALVGFTVAILLACGLFLSASDITPATASVKSCGSVKGSGPWSGTRATTNVTRGNVSCRVARTVARLLFSGRAKENDSCGYGYCSFKTVRAYGDVWRGDVQMGAWLMHKCRKLNGCGRVIRGQFSVG